MSEHLRTDLVLEAQKNVPVLYALATMIALNTVVWNPNLKKLSPHQRVAVCIPGSVVCVPACESRAGQQYRICYFSMRNN